MTDESADKKEEPKKEDRPSKFWINLANNLPIVTSLIAVGLYMNVLVADDVNANVAYFLDSVMLDNPDIMEDAPLKKLFFHDIDGGDITNYLRSNKVYRPLTVLSVRLIGSNAFYQRVANVLLHTFLCDMVTSRAWDLFTSTSNLFSKGNLNKTESLKIEVVFQAIIKLLFALHPTHAQVVMYFSPGRSYLLSMLFGMAVLNTTLPIEVSMLCFVASLLSCEVAMYMAPALVFTMLCIHKNQTDTSYNKSFQHCKHHVIGISILTIIYAIAREGYDSFDVTDFYLRYNTILAMTGTKWFINAIFSFSANVAKAFFIPVFGTSVFFDHCLQVDNLSDLKVAVPICILVIAGMSFVESCMKKNMISTLMVFSWFLVLAPTMGFLPQASNFSDCILFPTTFMTCYLVTKFVVEHIVIMSQSNNKAMLFISKTPVGALLGLLFAGAMFVANDAKYYLTEKTLLERSLETCPDSPWLNHNLQAIMHGINDLNEAQDAYEKAITLSGDSLCELKLYACRVALLRVQKEMPANQSLFEERLIESHGCHITVEAAAKMQSEYLKRLFDVFGEKDPERIIKLEKHMNEESVKFYNKMVEDMKAQTVGRQRPYFLLN